MALRRGIDSDSVTHVCKGRVLFFQLADIMSKEKEPDRRAAEPGRSCRNALFGNAT